MDQKLLQPLNFNVQQKYVPNFLFQCPISLLSYRKNLSLLCLWIRGQLPVWYVKSHWIDCIFMTFEGMKKFSSLGLPYFAGSIITSSDKSKWGSRYLSPFLLKLQLVRGRTWPFKVLKSSKFCDCFSDILRTSSEC